MGMLGETNHSEKKNITWKSAYSDPAEITKTRELYKAYLSNRFYAKSFLKAL